jgi:acetylornithine deacetylase/succinyl-diaminopimelate desuccinylase-like protein
MTRETAIAQATRHFDEGLFIEDLARRVAIRSESQIPDSHPQLRIYLEQEMIPAFAGMGFETEIMPNPVEGAGPILLAERIEAPGLPTVLMYGHGDVIRGLEGQWRAGVQPWQLSRHGDKYYGRGTADNKGQHSVNLAALQLVLQERGRLGFNVKFMVETSEELSSPGLREFCESHRERLRADVLIASDGPRLSAQRPTLYLGSRGCINLNFKVDLRPGGHHSGNWGGLLANPGIILANALASIVSRQGQVLVRELLPEQIPDSVRRALRDCQPSPEPDEPQIDAWWGEPGLSAAEKVYAWNTFEVLAFRTGNPDNPVNAIPGHAVATCQIRFVEGCDVQTFVPILRRHLDRHGFGQVEVSLARKSWTQATRLDPDDPWVVWASESIRRTTGHAPAVLPNIGGSLPNDCFARILDLPTLWIPHSYAGCAQHAPNEHALGSILREGLQMMTGLFWDLAEQDVPASKRQP